MNNTNNTNFNNWDTNEIKQWVDSYESTPLLRNENNFNTYKQAIIELFYKRGIEEYASKYLFYTYLNSKGTIQQFEAWNICNSYCDLMCN